MLWLHFVEPLLGSPLIWMAVRRMILLVSLSLTSIYCLTHVGYTDSLVLGVARRQLGS